MNSLVFLTALLAQDPQTPQTTTAALHLCVWPASIQLDSQRDVQRVVAVMVDNTEVARGAAASVTFAIGDPTLATVETRGSTAVVRPVADGDTELIVTDGDREVRVKVAVRNAGAVPLASFRNEIIPSLTASGCNAGSCHGAAAGKNGFGLTLFGYDPERDHRAMTRDLRGRRIDFAAPDQSLLLQKATTGASHQGGKRLQLGDDNYRRMIEWIEQGAGDDGDQAPVVTGIELMPSQAVLTGLAVALPFVVRARYSDGTDADVTAQTLWSSGNDGTARVDRGELVTTGRGAAVILARFHGHAAISRLRVHETDSPFTYAGEPASLAIDKHVQRALIDARTQPAERCDDVAFCRRVHLDLTGVLPTPEATRAFLNDASKDKRALLIDELLERPEFAAAQAAMWADVLQVDAQTMEPKGAALLGRDLRHAFATKRPFDQVVRELLTGSGATFTSAPANFQLVAKQPHLVAEKTAQVFLGVRLQCAQCHNHPFERWTMDDYYGFAAFFGHVGKKRGLDPYETVVWDKGDGEVRNLRNNQVMPPRLLGAGVVAIAKGEDRREVLAAWVTAGDNPLFARNVANRLWARLFGRGLVDPVDDVRIGNPPSHPELLDELAKLLVDSHFEVRHVVRAIANSRTYQAAVAAAGAEPRLFAGSAPRRLQAELLLDAIAAVTLVPTKYPGAPLGAPASAVDGGKGSVQFLDAFGRPARDSACACDRRDDPTLGQTLHLINGDTITQKLGNSQGRLRRSLKDRASAESMLDDLFLAAYCRPPTAAEKQRILSLFPAADAKAAIAAWEDIYWSVLNSKEFLFQH